MPGANCAIFGCSTYQKHKIIFKVLTKDDEYCADWKQKTINIITKDRVID